MCACGVSDSLVVTRVFFTSLVVFPIASQLAAGSRTGRSFGKRTWAGRCLPWFGRQGWAGGWGVDATSPLHPISSLCCCCCPLCSHMREATGFILVYDVTNRQSFESAKACLR